VISLTERLEKLNKARAASKARIALRSGRHQSISYELAKLTRDTTLAMKLELKLEKRSVA
jgi:hypothetical protein